jgi:hypothetical protein
VDIVKGNVIPAPYQVRGGLQQESSPHPQILSYKSSQDGLFCSINFNFHGLFHFFIPAFAGTGSVFLFEMQIPKIQGFHTKPDSELYQNVPEYPPALLGG